MRSRECCSGCGGDYYHYAGCARGEHGEVYHPYEEWISIAVNAAKHAMRDRQFQVEGKWMQEVLKHFVTLFDK